MYDYEAKLEGRNPYQAFRLSDKFAMAESFSWKELESIDLQANSPFVPIPAVVQKNELFEAMMLFNKKAFLEGFAARRNNLKKKNLLTARMYHPNHLVKTTWTQSTNMKKPPRS